MTATTAPASKKLMLDYFETAKMLGMPTVTLFRLHGMGCGPASFKVGRHVTFRRNDVAAYLADRERISNDMRVIAEQLVPALPALERLAGMAATAPPS